MKKLFVCKINSRTHSWCFWNGKKFIKNRKIDYRRLEYIKIRFYPIIVGTEQIEFSDLRIQTEKSVHFEVICEEIEIIISAERAIIIFFENYRRLLEFKESEFWNDDWFPSIVTADLPKS